ncbi:MAG: response regulator [Syntrophaceae bacterium]|nr:response regulator [Syntrophaceae bacterium]
MKPEFPLILIIDDEESIRRNLRAFLQDEGYEVLTTKSGEEAMEMLTSCKPDLAVVDIRLPGMDGNKFILSAHQIHPNMKFLVFTGSMEYTLPQELRSLDLSEQHILRKPLNDLSLLANLIKGQCERTDVHE